MPSYDESYFQAMVVVCATFAGAVVLRSAGWFCNAARGPRTPALPGIERGTLLLIVFLISLIDVGFVITFHKLFPPPPVLNLEEDDLEVLKELIRQQTKTDRRVQIHIGTELMLRVVLGAGILTLLLALFLPVSLWRAFLLATWYGVLWAWQVALLLFLFGIPKLLLGD